MFAILSAPELISQCSDREASREHPLCIALFTIACASILTGVATGPQTRVKASLALGYLVFVRAAFLTQRYFGCRLTALVHPMLVPLIRFFSENHVSTFFPEGKCVTKEKCVRNQFESIGAKRFPTVFFRPR